MYTTNKRRGNENMQHFKDLAKTKSLCVIEKKKMHIYIQERYTFFKKFYDIT